MNNNNDENKIKEKRNKRAAFYELLRFGNEQKANVEKLTRSFECEYSKIQKLHLLYNTHHTQTQHTHGVHDTNEYLVYYYCITTTSRTFNFTCKKPNQVEKPFDNHFSCIFI